MKFHRVASWCLCVCVWYCSAAPPQSSSSPAAGNEWPLDIRPDGSYRFAYSTGDAGRHYHTSNASPDNTVTGVFGYKDPKTGRDLQTKYSAGKRGFRANGPHIARRMDLSQNKIPYHPPVSPDSPHYNPTYSTYHDPNEDPTYSFEFHTPTHSRKEDSDYKADVNGRYSFIDDVGQRHVVEYEAGSKIGFHVKNAYPDSNPLGAGVFFAGPPANRKSSKPLRGHTAIQRGKDGSYSFTAVGPDQRRTEESDATGNVKGFYTYVDDKGVQRTTQYIAGPNIGYKIVSSHTNNRYPVLPYPPPYPPYIPPPTEDKDGGDLFGSRPDLTGTGGKPPGGSGQTPPGGDDKDPWQGLGPTGTTSRPSTTSPLPGGSGGGGFGENSGGYEESGDDLFGPPTGGIPTGNDNDDDYPNGQGYEYNVPGKDDGSFLLPQPSTSTSNIPYGNCCKLVPNRPEHGSKSASRPSRNHEQFVPFPSGVPIRAHVQSLDIKTYGSRLPAPGAAIDLPVPPKSRRGAESDEPDYWGIKVRRYSRVGEQETPNTQTSSRSARHSEGQTKDRQDLQTARNSDSQRQTSIADSEINQDALRQQISHSARLSDVHRDTRTRQPHKNQDTLTIQTSSRSARRSEGHGNTEEGKPDEDQDIYNLKAPSHSEEHGNEEAGQLEETQDIHKQQISLHSSRKSEVHENPKAGQLQETQDAFSQQTPTRSAVHLKTSEHGEAQYVSNVQAFSRTARHSKVHGNQRTGQLEENQDIHKLQSSSEAASHSEVHRDTRAGESNKNKDIHTPQTSSESTRKSEVHKNLETGEVKENQDLHNLRIPSESTAHRQSVETESEKNKDSEFEQEQRHWLGLTT